MAVKRYVATKDTTISNAYKTNLSTRATGSNMGASDILETFTIYAQASSSSGYSKEISKILVQFPVDSIASDRTAGNIPASGKVNFYLRLFNAEHSQTLPREFALTASAISNSWEEGLGLDMDTYTDSDAANWEKATDTDAAATTTFTFGDTEYNASNTATITLIDTAGLSRTYKVKNDFSADAASQEFEAGNSGAQHAAENFIALVNGANGHNGTITATAPGSGLVNLEQATVGNAGNKEVSVSGWNDITDVNVSDFSGGDGAWAAEGGDYHSSPTFSQTFDVGTEDFEVDITTLVEQWLAGTKSNYGLGVQLSAAKEAEERSYYTKRFFARGSEFFNKRPTIEARWDSATKDNRGNCFYSSSFVSSQENLNTLYLYNYVNGKLTNIHSLGTSTAVYVRLYSGSVQNNDSPTGNPLTFVVDGTHVRTDAPTVVTGGHVSTGIYSASFAINAASTPLTRLFDVWSGSADGHYFTGSTDPSVRKIQSYNSDSSHVTKIVNLKSIYTNEGSERFRVFVREKNWNPNIYNVASSEIKTSIIESSSYKILRTSDELEIISYGTGSDAQTQLSYDNSGSYFDLDMTMLQPGHSYTIKLAYYLNDAWVEQKESFKFRVE